MVTRPSPPFFPPRRRRKQLPPLRQGEKFAAGRQTVPPSRSAIPSCPAAGKTAKKTFFIRTTTYATMNCQIHEEIIPPVLGGLAQPLRKVEPQASNPRSRTAKRRPGQESQTTKGDHDRLETARDDRRKVLHSNPRPTAGNGLGRGRHPSHTTRTWQWRKTAQHGG